MLRKGVLQPLFFFEFIQAWRIIEDGNQQKATLTRKATGDFKTRMEDNILNIIIITDTLHCCSHLCGHPKFWLRMKARVSKKPCLYAASCVLYINIVQQSFGYNLSIAFKGWTSCKCQPKSVIQVVVYKREVVTIDLRTFARKFSNIDFFPQILPLKDDELVMSEM